MYTLEIGDLVGWKGQLCVIARFGEVGYVGILPHVKLVPEKDVVLIHKRNHAVRFYGKWQRVVKQIISGNDVKLLLSNGRIVGLDHPELEKGWKKRQLDKNHEI